MRYLRCVDLTFPELFRARPEYLMRLAAAMKVPIPHGRRQWQARLARAITNAIEADKKANPLPPARTAFKPKDQCRPRKAA